MPAVRQRMSSVDAAWLRMDRPSTPMMIVGVMTFDERLELGRVRRTIAERFLAFERFHARPDHASGWPAWQTDAEFDLERHVVAATLPAPAGQAQLERLVSRLAGQPLDRRRPLWQFHVVERYGPGSAVVTRIHHCYADGMALIRVMLSMTDIEARPSSRSGAGGAQRAPAASADRAPHPSSSRHELAAAGLALLEKALAGGGEWLSRNLGRGLEAASHPESVSELAQHALGILGEAARVATLPDDTHTRLKGPSGKARRVAWAEPLPLEEVRTVARALGVSINDVLMSTVAGALGSYLRSEGDPTAGLSIRAAVPVNLRHQDATLELGNRFGLVFLDLPVGMTHPLERLYTVHASMKALKDSYQPLMILGLLAALGLMPGPVESAAIDRLSAKVSAVVSNVPGPRQPLFFAGRRIAQQVFWVPQSGDVGLGVSVLTYAGQVQFGLIADRKRIPNPRAIVRRFGEQFEQLLLTVLMGPAASTASTLPDGS